jgi:hypothetical protein
MATPLQVQPAPFERNILLLDSSEARQFARAAAMRAAGASVQCVSSVSNAQAVWKPGSYQLVMIDLGGKGAAFREFYEYARGLSPKQAFAFYVPYPPYLSQTPDGGPQLARARHAAPAAPIELATGNIATRRTARVRRAKLSSGSSFGDAIKAAERE